MDYDLIDSLQAINDVTTGGISLPYPDVWAPLSDNLQMLAGKEAGTRTIKIGGVNQTVEDGATLSFTRASTATYVDKLGFVKTAEINEPRFEQQGLLCENLTTNHMAFSEDCRIRTDQTTKLTVNSEGFFPMPEADPGMMFMNGTALWPASAECTLSIYIKGTGKLIVETSSYSAFERGKSSEIDLDAITATGDGSIVRVTDDLYRVSLRVKTAVTPATFASKGLYINKVGTNTDVAANYCQLEAQVYATSYIPTNGAAVTRAQDICALHQRNSQRWGTLTVAVNMHTYDRAIEQAIDNASAMRTVLAFWDRPDMTLYIRNRSTGIYNLEYGSNYRNVVVKQPYVNSNIIVGKVHGATKKSRMRDLWVNGIKSTSSEPYTFDPVTEVAFKISIGSVGAPNRGLDGYIKNIRIWNTPLTDVQIKTIK